MVLGCAYQYHSTEAAVVVKRSHALYLDNSSNYSLWRRRLTMYRGAAPPLILCIVLLYALYASAVLLKTDQTLHTEQYKVLQEKQAYLQRIKELYGSVSELYNTTVDPNTFIRRLTVVGVVRELLSADNSPLRTVMPYMRANQILQESSDGNFESIVTVDPPFKGEQCFSIKGHVDYNYLSGVVTRLRPVSCSERPGTWNNYMLSEEPPSDGRTDKYTNGSKSINELTTLAEEAKCKKNSKDECGRGTVLMDPWLNQTLAFQRKLGQNLTLDRQQFLGSHNSFNNRADGYGDGDPFLNELFKIVSDGKWDFVWAQQYFSMTDQLNLGSRYLMLDPVYFWGAMRLCHCGTKFKWVDKVVDFLEKELHRNFTFDSGDLGCMPDDRKFEDGIREIHEWVTAPGNENEVVMVMVNDFSKDHDWGKISLIHQPIRELFGEMVFSPNDKLKYFPNRWPTSQELINLGKRVIVLGSERCANASLIFVDMTGPAWDKDSMKYFTPYPECGGYPGQWYVVGGESQLIGPIYNGPEEEGLITGENMQYLLQCPVTILKVDLISPALYSGGVWTWAQGYSAGNLTSGQCAAMSTSGDGRWVTLPCTTQLPYACHNGSSLALGKTPGAWDNKYACPTGFSYYLPTTGYENWQFYRYIITNKDNLQAKYVWINLPQSIL